MEIVNISQNNNATAKLSIWYRAGVHGEFLETIGIFLRHSYDFIATKNQNANITAIGHKRATFRISFPELKSEN